VAPMVNFEWAPAAMQQCGTWHPSQTDNLGPRVRQRCEVVISGTHAVTADDEPAIAAFSAPIKRKYLK
jgi:hypothetical protein